MTDAACRPNARPGLRFHYVRGLVPKAKSLLWAANVVPKGTDGELADIALDGQAILTVADGHILLRIFVALDKQAPLRDVPGWVTGNAMPITRLITGHNVVPMLVRLKAAAKNVVIR